MKKKFFGIKKRAFYRRVDSTIAFLQLNFFTTLLGGDFGRLGVVIKKLFNSVHIDCVSMKNLESVALMMSDKRCLDMTDRLTDVQSIFLVRLIKNIYTL